MPPPDAGHPELGHDDAAGWALGALDPADAEAFEAHLRDCARCQVDVAEFEAMTRALKSPAPAVEPPADLEARTLASVRHAIMTAAQAGQANTVQPIVATAIPARETATAATVQQAVHEARNSESAPGPAPARMSRWWHWHWNFPVFSLAAACGAAAAALVVVLVQAGQFAPLAAKFSMQTAGGHPAGTVVVHRSPNGWTLDAAFSHLRPLAASQYYECWYLKSASDPPSDAITAGSFLYGGGGTRSFIMTSAADPRLYKIMEITIQHPGDSGRPGQVILRGSAQPA